LKQAVPILEGNAHYCLVFALSVPPDLFLLSLLLWPRAEQSRGRERRKERNKNRENESSAADLSVAGFALRWQSGQFVLFWGSKRGKQTGFMSIGSSGNRKFSAVYSKKSVYCRVHAIFRSHSLSLAYFETWCRS
jgi:hypothetical protein